MEFHSQRGHKLSDEQIQHLMQFDHRKLDQLPKEEDEVLKEKLERDQEWCSSLLKNHKSLNLENYQGNALAEAMRFNRPEYVLQELRAGWMLLESAASLSSLQSLTLELKFDLPRDLPDKLVAALGGPNCKIWDLGLVGWNSLFRIGRVPGWKSALQRLCGGGVLKSLRLYDEFLSEVLLGVAAEKSPCQLEHLSLTVTNAHLSKLTDWGWGTLTSLHLSTGSKDFLQCTFHGIQHFGLHIYMDVIIRAEEFLQFLNASGLRRIFITNRHISPHVLVSREDQLQLVDYLDRNIDCPLEMIDGIEWVNKSIEQTCLDILQRNKAYREGGLLEEQQMPPSTVKLFICGDSAVGKSTLRKNLTRRTWVPNCMQFSRSTYGIRLDTLRFGDSTVVICDLAGQPEFHTLHHYFMRGTDKDLFLIVCKAPSSLDDPRYLENQMKYWLRFISAHRSPLEHKPRVLIVLNYFPGSDTRQDPDIRCQQVIGDYSEHIDFGPSSPNVFSLNLKSYRSVREQIKPKLKAAVADLIERRPKVPKLCKEILEKMNAAKRRPKVLSIGELESIYGRKGVNKNLFKVCIMYLHDTGEVLYIEDDNEPEGETTDQQLMVADVQWFLQEFVGQFLPRLDRDHVGDRANVPATQPYSEVKATIVKMCNRDDQHAEYLLSCLNKLGIILPSSSASNEITILPLIQTRLGHWQHGSDTDSYSFWGRRFDCKDSERRLLPFGIFNMLQVRLAGMKFSMTKIGKGWIYLVENRIHVIVKIGGSRGEWYDKHWVDVLVRIPFADDPSDYLLERGDTLFQQVKTCLFQLCGAANWGCRSLELEEKVIGPKAVEEGPDGDFRNVARLNQIMERIQEEGMCYSYTWPTEYEATPVFQLLFPSERDSYFHERKIALLEVEHQVKECLEPQATESQGTHPGTSAQPLDIQTMIRESESRIVMQVKESEKNIIKEIQRLELVVKNQIESLRLQGTKIMSKLEFHLEFEAPKYPFMTDDNNFLEKISALAFGTSSRLHFLCEHSQGCHPVENQKGIKIKVSPDWFKQAAPVLIPTLRILVFGLKMVAIVGFGVAIPTPVSAFPKGLTQKTIDAVCEQVFNYADKRLISMVPSGNDLKNFHNSGLRTTTNAAPNPEVSKESLKDFLKGTNMNEEFGLYQRQDKNGRRVWLCGKHI